MTVSDRKRTYIFLAFAFGIAWAIGLVVYLTGGLENSPVVIQLPGFDVSLAFILLAGGYMMAPSLGNILTRIVTKEGWQDLGLRPKLKNGWRYWLAVWLLTPAFIVLGAGLFYLLFPQYFDPSLDPVRKLISDLNPTAELSSNLWPIFIAQAVQSTISAPIFNGLFTLGEEFGWRAYLLPKLMPLGQGKAMLWMGLIWGVWHAPIIAMGHNYGLDYPGAPWLGMLVMIWFCFSIGTLFGWATLRAGSVWPAVIGHAVINGISGFVVYTIQAQPSPLLGPLSMGLIASIPFFLFSLAVIIAPGATKTPAEVPILAPENN